MWAGEGGLECARERGQSIQGGDKEGGAVGRQVGGGGGGLEGSWGEGFVMRGRKKQATAAFVALKQRLTCVWCCSLPLPSLHHHHPPPRVPLHSTLATPCVSRCVVVVVVVAGGGGRVRAFFLGGGGLDAKKQSKERLETGPTRITVRHAKKTGQQEKKATRLSLCHTGTTVRGFACVTPLRFFPLLFSFGFCCCCCLYSTRQDESLHKLRRGSKHSDQYKKTCGDQSRRGGVGTGESSELKFFPFPPPPPLPVRW